MINAMPTIRPISDLCDTNKISELCHARHEPVFITKNGYSDLVIMSAATYERQLSFSDAYRKLVEAEEHREHGVPNIPGSEVFDRLRKKYGTASVQV